MIPNGKNGDVRKSWRKGKKLAVYQNGWHHFGDSSMADFRTHKSEKRRKAYYTRHKKSLSGNSDRAKAFRIYSRKTWQEGGKINNSDLVSIMGYKKNSPFVEEPYLFINSPNGRITMKDVEFPIIGIDETGKTKMMIPNKEYKFEGKKVLEIPMRLKKQSQNKKLKAKELEYIPDIQDNKVKEVKEFLMRKYRDKEPIIYEMGITISRGKLPDSEEEEKEELIRKMQSRGFRGCLVAPTKMCGGKLKKKMISGGKIAGKSPENFLNEYNEKQAKKQGIAEAATGVASTVADIILPGSGTAVKAVGDSLTKLGMASENFWNKEKIKAAKQMIANNELYDAASNFESKYKQSLGYV